MSRSVMTFKEEMELQGIFFIVIMTIIWFFGEPLIEYWNFSIDFIVQKITTTRLFVYTIAIINILIPLGILGYVYFNFGKLKFIYSIIFLEWLDFVITGNNRLIEILIQLSSWMFGSV